MGRSSKKKSGKSVISNRKADDRTTSLKSEIRFKSIKTLEKAPSNGEIGDDDFILVVYKRKKYWTLFLCPCGCGHVISLSLQSDRRPFWTVKKTRTGQPSLYPSVWQKVGCKSHFWITNGEIIWARSSEHIEWNF